MIDYKFMDKIGKGSSGLVYKAHKLPNKKDCPDLKSSQNSPSKALKSESFAFTDCAIKIIKLDKEKLFDRLKIEIAIMKMCRHENIVQYYETYKHLKYDQFFIFYYEQFFKKAVSSWLLNI